MATWMTESDINSFLDFVPPCGRGQSLKVLQYLRHKGISPSCSSSRSSCASSDSSSSAGSDVEDRDRIFPVKTRSPGTCTGRGMVLRNYDSDRAVTFEGAQERRDSAVYNQLRRANRNGYTTDAFEYQVKMMHKAQEEKERAEQFEEATVDDTSSTDTSASHIESIALSSSPSFSSCSLPANLSETDLDDKSKQNLLATSPKSVVKISHTSDVEDEVKRDQVAEDVVQQPKPVYKSVRSRNVLLNALAKMALAQSCVQEPVVVDQVGTECNAQASSSSVVTSDDSASESPLIFDSAASSPQPDIYDQNCVSDGVYDYKQDFNDDTLVSSQKTPNNNNNNNLFFDDDNDMDNTISFNRDEINDVRPSSDMHFKKSVDYPSVVGQYYNNYVDLTPVNSDEAQCLFKANAKSCKFSPPSLAGLESLGYSPSKMNQYNAEFKLKLEEFPPLM